MADGYPPIHELNLLKEFQDGSPEYYADGFELKDFGHDLGLRHGCSAEPGFLSRLIEFADANGYGSTYAFWRVDDRADLATLPVVVFGGEGGQHVVARDLRELLRLLSYDDAVGVDVDSVGFSRSDDQPHSARHAEFLDWLHRHFGLAPVTDEDTADSIVEAAQAEHGDAFARWCEPYLAHWDS